MLLTLHYNMGVEMDCIHVHFCVKSKRIKVFEPCHCIVHTGWSIGRGISVGFFIDLNKRPPWDLDLEVSFLERRALD